MRSNLIFYNLSFIDYSINHFQKNFYQPHPNLANMDPTEAEKFRESKEITIKRGENVPAPITSFDEGGFPDYVMNEINC